jgi:CHAT domain-containing protein/Tfp pilus assembly protein PilF
MTTQEAVQLVNQLITCGSFNSSRELLKENLSQLDEVFFGVLRDFIKEVERVGQKEIAELLVALDKEAVDLLKGEEIAEESVSPSSIVDLFTSLVQEVIKGTLSIDEAVRRIRKDVKIKAVLNEQIVAELIDLTERLANQSPPLAYHLAYLTYEAAKVIDNRLLRGISSHTLGNLSLRLARYSQAIELHQEALGIAKELNDKQGIGVVLCSLCIAYYSLGQYQKAIGYNEEALKIAKEIGDRRNESCCLGELGNVYRSIGEYQKAISYYQEALKIAKEIEDRQGEGIWLGNLGIAYRFLGQYQRAISYYQEALKIAKEIGDRQGEGIWLGNLGIAYRFLGQYQKAIGYYQDALKIAKEIGDRRNEGNQLGNLGIVYRSLGQYQQAISHYQDALKIAKKIGDVDNEGLLNLNLGIVYDDHILKLHKAYDYYHRSIELSESMRGRLIEEPHKIGFFGRIEDAYYRMVPLCYKLKKEKEAYEYTERAKSRAFLDLLATTEIKPKVVLPEKLKEKENEYLGLLRHVQRKPYLEETTPKPQIDAIKVAKELEAIYDEIEKYDPEYASLRRGRPLNLNQIQDLLETQDRRTSLVEYFVTEDDVFIFVIRGDDSRLYVEKKPISGERLYRYIENYFREVANYLEYGDMRQTWQELSQYLIEPIAKYLKRGDIIYIVPHGVLHYLPFHALRHNGKYLIEDFQIVYSPSASLIKYCQKKRHPEKERALVFGNPTLDLKFAEEEAKEVARLFNTEPYLGTKATKSRIKSSLTDIDIIHFACHGWFDPNKPMSSYIKLADGELTAEDTFNLRFRANIVVLSACKTGRSEISSGDELIGLIRAFIYAGTPSLIASLWNVDDVSTSRLMVDFYKRWKENGQSKVEALRDAQLQLMKDSKYTHPYYWAPFILVGDWK